MHIRFDCASCSSVFGICIHTLCMSICMSIFSSVSPAKAEKSLMGCMTSPIGQGLVRFRDSHHDQFAEISSLSISQCHLMLRTLQTLLQSSRVAGPCRSWKPDLRTARPGVNVPYRLIPTRMVNFPPSRALMHACMHAYVPRARTPQYHHQ